MTKRCTFCNAEMPEEAHICLSCFNVCKEPEYSELFLRQSGEKNKSVRHPSIINNRKFSNILTAAICAFVVLPSMILPQLGSTGSSPALDDSSSNSAAKGSGSVFSRIEAVVKDALGISDSTTQTEDETTAANNLNVDDEINNITQQTSEFLQTDNSNDDERNTSDNITENKTPNKAPANGNGNSNSETVPNGKVEYDKWEYTENNGKLTITKYTGSAKTVVIPEVINGKTVRMIDKNTFLENNTMQYAVFQDFTTYHNLTVRYHSFYKCGNLKKIVFPKNADLGILDCFAAECYSLCDIEISNYQYKFIDGALIYYNTNYWQIYYYCEGYKSDTFTYPEYVQVPGAPNLFKYAKNLKNIYLSSEMTIFFQQYDTPYLESVYAKNNSQFKDIDGVLYKLNSSGKWEVYNYPNNHKAAEFELPENSIFNPNILTNKYLKTIKIPASAEISEYTLKHICRGDIFPNLQTVYIENGSSYESYIKNTFTGKVIVY